MHHIDKYQSEFPELTKQLKSSFYVDDLVAGASDVNDAVEFYKRVREVMAAGGMNLRKWKSNSPELMKLIERLMMPSEGQGRLYPINPTVEEEDESYAGTVMGHCVPTMEQPSRILGVIWDHTTDSFRFDLTHLESYVNLESVTKRVILRLTAKIFDPLGLVSPFVIQLKLLFQSLCQDKLEWDTPLSGELLLRWKAIISEISNLNGVSVARCYFSFSSTRLVQLHGFCDASEHAYAAVVYLRCMYGDGVVGVSLVACKTRVSPLKKLTIPRLELMGALILSRLMANVITSLSQNLPTFYWTDSMTALHWIRTPKPWKQYINHRVVEIRNLSDHENWQFCPGNLNPADVPSRGMSGVKLANCSLWWNGPDFLREPEQQWPRAEAFPSNEVTEAEVIKHPLCTTHVLLNSNELKVGVHTIIDHTRFSSLNKLLRVTAYVRRFVTLSRRQGLPSETVQTSQFITAIEVKAAEELWMRSVQSESFGAELAYCQSNGKQGAPLRVSQFGLFIDDHGLLRCRGRINNALLNVDCKNPILLPSDHAWVKLLIQHVHREIKHSGTADTLATLREKYWILKGRQTVKKVIRSCVTCNKLEGASYSASVPPDLPDFRTSDDPPFCHTGIDFAGPLFVKSKCGSDKAYVCLLTCCSTRAVHLELTPDMSVDSFLLCFRRFVGRRGLPVTLVSDNAKTFQSSSKEVLKIARSQKVSDYLSSRKVAWKFIVERAPWWGGFYECEKCQTQSEKEYRKKPPDL